MLPPLSTVYPLLRLPVIVSLVLLAFVVLGSAPVSANGRATLVSTQEQGPYRLEVSILPGQAVVNNTHLSIRIVSLDSEEALTDAVVRVSATGPAEAADFGSLLAVNNISPQFFETALPFDLPGDWQVSISVDSDLGQETIQVPMNVRAGGQINLILVAAIAVAVVAVAICIYDRIKSRLRKSS